MMHFFKNLQSDQKGLTLIEVTILLLVAGLILIPILNFYSQEQKTAQYNETTKKLPGQIQNALRRYVMAYDRYPAPANFNNSPTTAGFGIELTQAATAALTTACGADTATVCVVDNALIGDPSDDILIGAVPVRSLGLPDRFITDSYGSKWIYAVTRDLVDGTTGFSNGGGLVTVQPKMYDGTGASVTATWDHDDDEVDPVPGSPPPPTPTPRQDRPDKTTEHYALVSLGEGRDGAHSINGVLVTTCASASPNDQNNCNRNGTFWDNLDKMSLVPGANYYDDHVFSVSDRRSDIWSGVGTTGDLFNLKLGNMMINVNNLPDTVQSLEPLAKVHVSGDVMADIIELNNICTETASTTDPNGGCPRNVNYPSTGSTGFYDANSDRAFTVMDIIGYNEFTGTQTEQNNHEHHTGRGIFCGRKAMRGISHGNEVCTTRRFQGSAQAGDGLGNDLFVGDDPATLDVEEETACSADGLFQQAPTGISATGAFTCQRL